MARAPLRRAMRALPLLTMALLAAALRADAAVAATTSVGTAAVAAVTTAKTAVTAPPSVASVVAAAPVGTAAVAAVTTAVTAPPSVASVVAAAPVAAAGPVPSAIPGQGTMGPQAAPVTVAQAPAAGVSAWAQPGTTATGVQQFGVWTVGRLVQIAVAVVLLVLVCFFMIVSSRQMADNWDQEQHSEEWRPFAKAGKSYGAQRPGDDNPWREGSGLMQPKMGGYAPNAPPMPALVSSQTRTAPEDWDKLPSWA